MTDSPSWTQTFKRDSGGPPPELPKGDSRYQTVGLLGEGGMGRVIEAVDKQFHRVVAVKELRGDRIDPESAQRFELEALITGNLEHPGVPAVYERGTRPDGVPYYVMRRVKGRNFGEALQDARTLEHRLALMPAVLQASLAVGFAHQQTVVHRDLKPGNIVVGAHGEVVVIDWGLAKVRGVALFPSGEHQAVAAAESRPGHVQGTPAYMAPEQAFGRQDEVDERTDVWALGAVLYEVLTGRPPYDGATVEDVLRQARECKPAAIEKLAPSAPQQLRRICEKAMSADPKQRYPSATELGEALRGFATRAISDTSERHMSMFANIAGLGTVLMLIAVFLVVSTQLAPYSVYGAPVLLLLLLTLTGLLTSFLEERTQGRHQLGTIALVINGATALCTIAGAGGQFGMRHNELLRLIGSPTFSTEIIHAAGAATGFIAIGMFHCAIQIVVWGVIRRRLLLSTVA